MYWSYENNHKHREATLRDVKFGIWCAVSAMSKIIDTVL
jgi:hypothetical protein